MNDLDDAIFSAVDVSRLARKVCDVHFGIGADGLILVKSSERHDYRMVILNADGSEAEMCGNGIRCMVRFLAEEQITDATSLTIETLAGPILTTLNDDGRVQVDMGKPVFRNSDIVSNSTDELVSVVLDGLAYTYVSMGNPHAVAFVDQFAFDWKSVARQVEQNVSVFPSRTNVEFVKVENERELTMKVWERGCGETMACGTGTCALVVAAVHRKLVREGDVLVHLPGGDLSIHYCLGESVGMTGTAEMVCSGVYSYPESE